MSSEAFSMENVHKLLQFLTRRLSSWQAHLSKGAGLVNLPDECNHQIFLSLRLYIQTFLRFSLNTTSQVTTQWPLKQPDQVLQFMPQFSECLFSFLSNPHYLHTCIFVNPSSHRGTYITPDFRHFPSKTIQNTIIGHTHLLKLHPITELAAFRQGLELA